MKTKITILLFAGFGILTFSSYQDGPHNAARLNRTGSGGTSANCSTGGCHSANTSNTLISFSLMDDADQPVTEYIPGASYTVLLAAENPTNGLSKFGFQASVVKAGATSTQAGNITSTQNATSVQTTSNNIQIIEHSSPIDATVVSAPTNRYEVRFGWTAPAAGTGTVRFYTIVNAVNNNNNISGDQPNAAQFEYPESSSTSLPQIENNLVFSAYPNPAQDLLNIQLQKAGNSITRVSVYNAAGQLIDQEQIAANTARGTLHTGNWSKGLYYVTVQNDKQKGIVTIVK